MIINNSRKVNSYNAALLLGGGLQADGTINNTSKQQVEYAVNLYNNGIVNNLIMAGSYSYKGAKSTMTEAQAYANYAYTLNVPKDKIHLEETSKETLGNILFSKMHILAPNKWLRVIIIPGINHSNERIQYLAQKVLGPSYTWIIQRSHVNTDTQNYNREMKSLALTKEINDAYKDGDDTAIYNGLIQSHPAYGGNRFTIEELKAQLG